MRKYLQNTVQRDRLLSKIHHKKQGVPQKNRIWKLRTTDESSRRSSKTSARSIYLTRERAKSKLSRHPPKYE